MAHFGASDATPRWQQAPPLSQFRIRFHRSPATFTFCWTPTVNTTLSSHPWGLLSWQLDHIAITASSGYGVPCGLPGVPLMGTSTAKLPSSHSTQGCLAWAWPAHLFDSLSASETGPRQLPRSCPMPFRARRSEGVCGVCVCVCVCVLCTLAKSQPVQLICTYVHCGMQCD